MKRVLFAVLSLASLIGCGTTSNAPTSAKTEKAEEPASVGSIARLDSRLDALVPASARIEKLADGFQFIEGPLWFPAGYLWFSDVVGNVVRQWSPDGKVIEVLRPGGADKSDAPPGSFI